MNPTLLEVETHSPGRTLHVTVPLFGADPTNPKDTGDSGLPDRQRRRWLGRVLTLLAVSFGVAGVGAAIDARAKVTKLEEQLHDRNQPMHGSGDTLGLSERYDSLSTEALDLQQELHARQTGVFPPTLSVIHLPLAPGTGRPLRPVPSYFRMAPTSEDRRLAAIAAHTPSDRRRRALRATFTQDDVSSSGVIAELTSDGFIFSRGAAQRRGPTNSIVFGGDVPIVDVLQVAYRLIESGIQVKRIRRIPERSRRTVLELQFAKEVVDWPELTMAELQRFRTGYGS